MEAGFQVQHADPLSLPELCPVPPHIVELVLILSHPFVDWDNVLAYLSKAAWTKCLALGAMA